MQITVQLFGTFRSLGTSLVFKLGTGATIQELRDAMHTLLQERNPDFAKNNILAMSRFSNETNILDENTLLQDQQILAILPPVSGG